MSRMWASVQGLVAEVLDEVFPKAKKTVSTTPVEDATIELDELEGLIDEFADEVGVVDMDDIDSYEKLEIIRHGFRCEVHRNAEYSRKYASPLPLSTEALGKVSFDSTNNCLDHKWESTDEWADERRDNHMTQAGAVATAVVVAIYRIPDSRLEELRGKAASDREFIELAVQEALTAVDRHPKMEA